MKSDRDFHEVEILRMDTLPAPLNKDHNYFSMTAEYSSAATDVCDRNQKPISSVVKNCKNTHDVTTTRKPRIGVTKIRNPDNDVITTRKPRIGVTKIRNPDNDVITTGIPATDSIKNSITYSDATAEGNPFCDVRRGTARYADDVLKRKGDSSLCDDIEAKQVGGIVSASSPEHRASEGATDVLAMFTDSKDVSSSQPCNMLIDVEAIGSLLLQAKTVMEPPRVGATRMKLDSRYRTNSSDSAFSEDSFLEEDEDVKLEDLISQFIFNPANLRNDLPEYAEPEQNGPAEDVEELDVTDLFSSADIFGPNLVDPAASRSRFVARVEPESGCEESSENSVYSDNRDNYYSPVKKHKTLLLKKKDSVSSLSSSSSSSFSSSSSSLSLSSLSLDALSSATVGKSIDDPHPVVHPNKNQGRDDILDEGRVDSETSATSLAATSTSSLMGLQTKGGNSDVQGEDSTGFLTLPITHHLITTTTAKTQTSTSNSTLHNNNNNNNKSSSSSTNHKIGYDDADNYELLLNHLRSGFPPSFEIRGENSYLLLDEPDFVDFPFSPETENCRPNRSDFTMEKEIEQSGDQPPGSIDEIHGYVREPFRTKIAVPVVEGEGVTDFESGNLATTTASLYLNNPNPLSKATTPTTTITTTTTASYPVDGSGFHLNDVGLFTDVIDLDPKRDIVDESYLSESPYIVDWLSLDDSRVDAGLIDSTFHSTFSMADDCIPKHAKQRKGNDIVQLIPDYSPSSPHHPPSLTSTTLKSPQKKRSSSTMNDVQSQTLKTGETPKPVLHHVHHFCSSAKKKSTSYSKRPVPPPPNAIKKVPHKKKSTSTSSSHNKTLPVPADCHQRKTISYLNRAPIRVTGTCQSNRNESNQSKSPHYPQSRIEIVSWDDTGSVHVKVPKLSPNNKQSGNNQNNQVQCSLLRQALTAEESQSHFVRTAIEDKNGQSRSVKQCRNDTCRLSNDALSTRTQNSGCEMSELEKYLRGLIPTDAGNKGLGGASDSRTSGVEDLSQISVLRKLLTGEMSAHAYQEIDRRICEQKKMEIK